MFEGMNYIFLGWMKVAVPRSMLQELMRRKFLLELVGGSDVYTAPEYRI